MDKRFKYSTEMIKFIETEYKEKGINEVTIDFNLRFNLDKTPMQIKGIISNRGITCGRSTGALKKGTLVSVTTEQLTFVADAYLIHRRVDLPALFKQRFGIEKTYNQIVGLIKNHKLNSGRSGHFLSGNKSWNSGTKGVMKANSGSFKKGGIPHNSTPVGSYRITTCGYPQYKISEPGVWVNESCLVWCAHYGDYDPSLKIYHKDGNKINTNIDNLVLVDNSESMYLTHMNLKSMPDDFKDSAVLIARINAKSSRIEKDHGDVSL